MISKKVCSIVGDAFPTLDNDGLQVVRSAITWRHSHVGRANLPGLSIEAFNNSLGRLQRQICESNKDQFARLLVMDINDVEKLLIAQTLHQFGDSRGTDFIREYINDDLLKIDTSSIHFTYNRDCVLFGVFISIHSEAYKHLEDDRLVGLCDLIFNLAFKFSWKGDVMSDVPKECLCMLARNVTRDESIILGLLNECITSNDIRDDYDSLNTLRRSHDFCQFIYGTTCSFRLDVLDSIPTGVSFDSGPPNKFLNKIIGLKTGHSLQFKALQRFVSLNQNDLVTTFFNDPEITVFQDPVPNEGGVLIVNDEGSGHNDIKKYAINHLDEWVGLAEAKVLLFKVFFKANDEAVKIAAHLKLSDLDPEIAERLTEAGQAGNPTVSSETAPSPRPGAGQRGG